MKKMKRSDTLAILQRKYGNGKRAPWKRVATEELHLAAYKIRVKEKREEWSVVLGLHQLDDSSQKSPWFASLPKLAEYLDNIERAAERRRA